MSDLLLRKAPYLECRRTDNRMYMYYWIILRIYTGEQEVQQRSLRVLVQREGQ